MTIHEASERYHIPLEILREYESWELCGTIKKVIGSWQYDDTDLERLSMIMTLRGIGFASSEIEAYMRLLLYEKNTEQQRMRMLNEKRRSILDDIHFREKQLEWLDYLRYRLRKQQEEPVPGHRFPDGDRPAS